MESDAVSTDGAEERLLAKLAAFSRDLDENERAALARLLAPGVSLAFDEAEVGGFAMVDWPSDGLGEALGDALRRSGLRVEGLGEQPPG